MSQTTRTISKRTANSFNVIDLKTSNIKGVIHLEGEIENLFSDGRYGYIVIKVGNRRRQYKCNLESVRIEGGPIHL